MGRAVDWTLERGVGTRPGPAAAVALPTITDANAVLGYLNPETRLGDRISLDIEAAKQRHCAHCTGAETEPGGNGARHRQGRQRHHGAGAASGDGGTRHRRARLYAPLALAAAVRCMRTGLADLYGIGSIVVPNASSAFSALGCLTADFQFSAAADHPCSTASISTGC